jgi:hypothetical protein
LIVSGPFHHLGAVARPRPPGGPDPSLHFKKVHDRDPIYSARVTLGYRAVGLLEGDEITSFWIGPHAEYDRLQDRL